MPAKFPWPRAVALLVLLLLPCLQYPGAMPGPKVVAADEHLSVHHAFRSAEGPGGWVRNHQLSDPAVQFRPLRDRIRRSWSSGRPPLWNPDLHAGVPLLADGLSAGMYPPVSLELVLPPATAQDLRLYLALVGAGLGAALLAWLLGASAAGGLVAGAVAMLSAFPVCRLLHPHAWVYAWTPWLAWALLLLGRRRGGSWLVAVFWAAMLLAGHPQTAVHGLLFALAVAACLLRGWRAWAQLLLGLAVGSLLAAPALLPFAEHLSSSVTLGVRGSQSLPWSSLLTLAWPDPFGHPARGDWAGSGTLVARGGGPCPGSGPGAAAAGLDSRQPRAARGLRGAGHRGGRRAGPAPGALGLAAGGRGLRRAFGGAAIRPGHAATR